MIRHLVLFRTAGVVIELASVVGRVAFKLEEKTFKNWNNLIYISLATYDFFLWTQNLFITTSNP